MGYLRGLSCLQIMAFRLLLCWGQVVRDAWMDLRLPPEGALPGQGGNARTRISRLSGSIVIPSAFATRSRNHDLFGRRTVVEDASDGLQDPIAAVSPVTVHDQRNR